MNDEELRNRYRGDRPNYGPAGSEPPLPIPNSLKHAYQPPPSQQEPQIAHQPELHSPRPASADAHHALRARKPQRRAYKKPLGALLVLMILAGGGALGYKSLKPAAHPEPTAVLGSQTSPQIKIPVYYPLNLPAGYTFNKDFKVLGPNVLYYSVTGPRGVNYYATIQSLPPNFDFTAFKTKFSKPDEYTTSIGSALAGPVGATLIASVRTTTNDWSIINAPSNGNLAELETISRSLQLAKYE
jgi:hypothetical protein